MSRFVCSKCEKEYKIEKSYDKHIDKCMTEDDSTDNEEIVVKSKKVTKKAMVTKNTKKANDEETYTRPFIKWVGGKTQILPQLLEKFPKTMNNYHEIFLGGGSVLFAFLKHVKDENIIVQGEIYAYDLNDQLIEVYNNIKNHPNKVYDEAKILIDNINSCDTVIRKKGVKPNTMPSEEESMLSTENYYYWIRNKYNDMELDEQLTPLGSAIFIFLNKTCFRGVYRVGPKGFNVPFGNNKNPEIVNKEHLQEISKLIQKVNFICCDFDFSLILPVNNDFVYLDPPYAPEAKNSFVGYTIDGFNLENHESLFSGIHDIRKYGVNIMMSNADVELVRENFDDAYNIDSILCKRAIHSKEPGTKTMEVIITNDY